MQRKMNQPYYGPTFHMGEFSILWHLSCKWYNLCESSNSSLAMSVELSPPASRQRYEQNVKQGKAVPLQAQSGPEGSRKLRFLDFMTTAQDGGKFVSLTYRPPLPPRNTPGTHFYQRLRRPQGHSSTERIMSLKNSNEIIGNQTRDLPVFSVVL